MMYLYHSRSLFRRIARELNISVHYQNNRRIINRSGHTIRDINVGCTSITPMPKDTLNSNIKAALSKVQTFSSLDAVSIRHPPIFTTVEQAMAWPHGWLGRRDGLSGGRGISIFNSGQEPLQAAQFDFMVGIIPGKAEYRIHVGKKDGEWEILATQQKMGVKDNENVIRNYENGVTYSTQELRMSSSGRRRANEWAIAAVDACGLDFGAVDLLQSVDGLLYVLEINTAPGIRSDPIYQAYLKYFSQFKV